jgi:flagellar hook-basal body complex protein FliE
VGAKPPVSAAGTGQFSQVISQLIDDANTQQLQSNQAVEQFAAGRTDNIHEVVLTAAKADLSFRLVLEIRNRLIESYQEIMRMQM